MAPKHQTVKLEFTKREGTGKGTCRKLRSKDQLPVVLYGPEYKNGLAGIVSARAVTPVANSAHRETTIIELDFADGGAASALIRDVQRHPLTRRILHVDFYQVLKGHKIKVEVPIHVVNEELCKGIKDGGVLVYGERFILVEVEPSDIPEEIIVDAQGLEIGSEVFVKDLALPEGVAAVTEADLLVLHVEQPDEEVEGETLAAAEENTEVEVVAKGKAAKEEE